MSEERRASCGCVFDGEWLPVQHCEEYFRATGPLGRGEQHIARAAAEIASQEAQAMSRESMLEAQERVRQHRAPFERGDDRRTNWEDGFGCGWHAHTQQPAAMPIAPRTQPAPIHRDDAPDITELVIERLKARREQGIATYGTTLQAGNGRDALEDALAEALDLSQYLTQAIEERRAEQSTVLPMEAASLEEIEAGIQDALAQEANVMGSLSSEYWSGLESGVIYGVRWCERRGGADWRGLLERYYATIRHWTVVRNDGGVEPVARIDAEVATALAQRPAASAEGEQTP